jgi:hypothetical protein
MSAEANNIVELKPAQSTRTDAEPDEYREYRDWHREWVLKHLPRWAVELLKEIQKVAPEAFIGGGLLRDLANSLPIEKLKDVDVFYSLDHHEEVVEVVKQSHPEVEEIESTYKWRADDDRCVGVVHECRSKVEGVLPVNLVGMAMTPEEVTVEKIIADFDFGMCRIGFDGERIIATEAFWEDQAYQKFTLTRCLGWDDFDRSMERFKRFEAKYTMNLEQLKGLYTKFDLPLPEPKPYVRLAFAPQFKAYELHIKCLEELRGLQQAETEKGSLTLKVSSRPSRWQL